MNLNENMELEGKTFKLDLSGVRIQESAERHLKDCCEFLDGIEDVEVRERLLGTLKYAIEMLRNIGNPVLYHDFAPLSFIFSAGGLQGGLIFHGPCDGSGPNFCVTINQTSGWMLHT